MVVDAGDTGVLLHLFLVNVASLRNEEEKILKRWALFLKAQYCHLTREYKNAYSILRRLLRALTNAFYFS